MFVLAATQMQLLSLVGAGSAGSDSSAGRADSAGSADSANSAGNYGSADSAGSTCSEQYTLHNNTS